MKRSILLLFLMLPFVNQAQSSTSSFPSKAFFVQKWENYISAFTKADYETLGNQFQYPVTLMVGSPLILQDKSSFLEVIKRFREKGVEPGYAYSKTDAIELVKLSESACYLDAHFSRYNSANEIIAKGRGLYFLKKTNDEWKFHVNMAVN